MGPSFLGRLFQRLDDATNRMLIDHAATPSSTIIASIVEEHYWESGQFIEKYDVETCTAGSGGEYATEMGFGWTNGVTLELLATRGAAATSGHS